MLHINYEKGYAHIKQSIYITLQVTWAVSMILHIKDLEIGFERIKNKCVSDVRVVLVVMGMH